MEQVLRPRDNTFEPGKRVEYDPSYTGDQLSYLYEKEEKELQDKLFQIYEDLSEEEDNDQGYGYEDEEELPKKWIELFNYCFKFIELKILLLLN